MFLSVYGCIWLTMSSCNGSCRTFKPLWKEITHNDVSVRWWKKYYLFSLPDKVIPNTVKQSRIKQVFQALCKHETVGIHVKQSYFQHISMDEKDLSPE